MVDICWEGRCETQGAGNPREGTGAGDAEGRRRTAPAPGESVPVYFLAAWATQTGKAQNAGAAQNAGTAKPLLLWNTRGLEPCAAQGTLHIEQPGAWAA